MSMLSAQCDELRELAGDGSMEWVAGPFRASVLREAADTIDRLDAENAKLRKRVAELEELLPDSGRWYRAETVEAYVAENARLWELVRDYEHCSMHADCGKCEYDGMTSTHCPLSPCFPDIDELHELGVEVEP